MTIRIAKYIADTGIASRRGAEEMILMGRVRLNGRVVMTPVCFVEDGDVVTVDGRKLAPRMETCVIAFHKPINTLTTREDPAGRRTIYDVLPAQYAGFKYIGRLDFKTTGLLLMTNDGELARKLTLPASGIRRVYFATVDGYESKKLDAARNGITVEGVHYAPMKITELPNNVLKIEITEGKKNEIRVVLRACGAPVVKLRRESYGDVKLGNLPVGKIRKVEQKVIDAMLKYI